MAEKKITKKTVGPVPNSMEELADFVRQIGEHQRKLMRIQATCNERIERIKKQAMGNSALLEKAKDELFEGIFIYCQSQRDELTEHGKKKTVQLPTGEICWRMTPPFVSISNAKKVIELCQSRGFSQFIRIKEEVDKEAILKDQETAGKIPGVKIDQKEEFSVKPSQVEIEIFRDTAKLQKTLSKK